MSAYSGALEGIDRILERVGLLISAYCLVGWNRRQNVVAVDRAGRPATGALRFT